MKILIADNEPHYYLDLEANLAHGRPQQDCIVHALNANEAYDLLSAPGGEPFDLVILDEFMDESDEELNGSALLLRLQDHPVHPEPTIIYVTQRFNDVPVQKISRAGRLVSLFIDKTSSALLYRAVLLVARQKEGGRRHPADFFGDDFIALLAGDVEESMTPQWCAGYYSDDQRLAIASMVRSFFATLRMRDTWTPDDVLELSVFLAEGLCRVFDLPEQLVMLVRKFFSVEEVLYTIPRYRDHFLHQLKVFLLGYVILNQLNRRRRLDGTVLAAANGMKLWFMASLFHDLGYPFEKIRSWLDSFVLGVLRSPADAEKRESLVPIDFNWGVLFARRYHWYHMERIAEKVCRCYSRGNPRDEITRRINLLVRLATYVAEKPDHAVFSALILQNFLRATNVEDDEIDTAVAAVALHSRAVSSAVSEELGRDLTFREDPVSFLLMFCDTSQEWGRAEAALRDIGPSPTGLVTFDGLIWDETRGVITVEIRFAKTWTQPEIDGWHERVFKPILLYPSAIWKSSFTSPAPLSFLISYFHGATKQDRRSLNQLHFS